MILSVYRNIVLLSSLNFNDIRGIPYIINEIDYVWDETACGSKLIIEDNGKIVQANNCGHQNVRGKKVLENKGIFEWDVIIEKTCTWSWVGVCASENFSYENFAGHQPTGWVLGSNGNCCNANVREFNYCPSFHKDGARVTVHLDMNKITCAFTVNGTRYREISEWNNLPSKLYPAVSICSTGRFRIQPHQKNLKIIP